MRYFDLLAPLYDHFMPRPDPAVWQDLLGLPTAGPLLDAGGGTGRISAALGGRTGPVVVADIAHRMLRRAQRKGDLHTVQADAAHLPFHDAAFTRAVVADALHHFPEQQAAVRELVRVLAPGGRLVIEEFDLRRLPVKVMALAETALLMGSRFLRPDEIGGILAACGMRTEIRHGPYCTVWIIAEKG